MVDLARLRAQWEQMVPGLRAKGWLEADLAELRALCRDGMSSGDIDTIRAWERYIGDMLLDLVVQSCSNCAHRATPGRSDGHCAERPELPPAYGPGHPLRKLPSDHGRTCAKWIRS